MSSLHHPYRTTLLNFSQICVVALYGVLHLQAGQVKPADIQATQTKNAVLASAAAAPAAQQPGKQGSVEAMMASVDKQKASVRAQTGSAAAAPTDAFFTAPWTTPASIPVPAVVPSCTAMPEAELKPLVEDAAKAQGLKPELIRAVIRRESASYPCAISEKGATGLMQLMPDVAQQFGADPLDPKQNVQAGSRYLKQLMSRYKDDLKLALAAYNAGPQLVDAKNKVPDIPETTGYVDAILKELTDGAPATP